MIPITGVILIIQPSSNKCEGLGFHSVTQARQVAFRVQAYLSDFARFSRTPSLDP